jgi:hypothetical protein
MTELQRRVLAFIGAHENGCVFESRIEAHFHTRGDLRTNKEFQDALTGLHARGLIAFPPPKVALTPAGRALFDKLGVEA